ncbi:MAG TPA: hypothetical protein VHW45_10170 [Candidatus Sulfotelmatobacter sp.]|jgi:hypothetical protein|nr:hypothetical protein [Candidatus Sulfotelmatobacter sp.]
MKQRVRGSSQRFAIAIVLTAFLVWSEMPLMASPPQQSAQSDASKTTGDPLPEAPQPQSLQTPQQPAQSPAGAAAAKAANPKGAPVAQPVGAAVAPAKQHGHRSLLIKIGLLAGAGVAVGTVIALSGGSPSRPPGTAAATHR